MNLSSYELNFHVSYKTEVILISEKNYVHQIIVEKLQFNEYVNQQQQVVPTAQISLILFLHLFLSSITPGRSSKRHLVSAHCFICVYVEANCSCDLFQTVCT